MNENSELRPEAPPPEESAPEVSADPVTADQVTEDPVTADRVLAEAISDEGGQATVETVILIAAMILALTASFKAFPGIVRDYYYEMTRLMIFPIP